MSHEFRVRGCVLVSHSRKQLSWFRKLAKFRMHMTFIIWAKVQKHEFEFNESYISSIFHGWNPWCPDSLDILSHRVLHPLNRKLFYVTTWHWKLKLLTLSVSVCVLQTKRKENLFTFRGLLCDVFDIGRHGGVRCDISSSFRTLPCSLDMIYSHF